MRLPSSRRLPGPHSPHGYAWLIETNQEHYVNANRLYLSSYSREYDAFSAVEDEIMARHKRFPMLRALFVGILLFFSSTDASAQPDKLVIFAAASLKDALDEANAAYQRNKGQQTATSFAASSTLAKQIEAAAPADIFISADLDWMDYLEKRNLIKPETRTNLLGNQLVLIAPSDSTTQIDIEPDFPLAQALGGGRLAIADPRAVP